MLNWIAIFGGQYLFELGGPLQGSQASVPQSNEIANSARMPAIWGTLQPLDAGIFIALGALVVYWFVLNRTTLGFEVKAVGFNAEAARYGGISVSRNYVLALGDRGRVRGPGGRHGHPRLGVLDRDERHPGEPDRLHRHRRRAARPRPGGRDPAGGAALRRPRGGDVDTRARPVACSRPSWPATWPRSSRG